MLLPYLADIEIGSDDVPLLPGFGAATLHNRRIPDAARTLGRLDDRLALVQGLERHRIIAVAQIKIHIRIGSEEESSEISDKAGVGSAGDGRPEHSGIDRIGYAKLRP